MRGKNEKTKAFTSRRVIGIDAELSNYAENKDIHVNVHEYIRRDIGILDATCNISTHKDVNCQKQANCAIVRQCGYLRIIFLRYPTYTI